VASHASAFSAVTVSSSVSISATVSATATSTSKGALPKGGRSGTAMVAPFGNVTLGFAEVTVACVPGSAMMPGLLTTKVTRPRSSASRNPSWSHDFTSSFSLISEIARRDLRSELSATPMKSFESRAGDSAQVPAPRLANPRAIASMSASLLA
jgi:hypothetical protein